MAKRGVSRRTSRVSRISHHSSSPGVDHLNQVLIDNFVRLQKVMVSNAEKIDLLTNNISRLLQIFEVSAKSFAEKNFHSASVSSPADLQKEAEFLNKLNTLLDQNKTIAKGLSLLGDDLKEKLYGDAGGVQPKSLPSPTPSVPHQRFERITPPSPRMRVSDSPQEGFDKRMLSGA